MKNLAGDCFLLVALEFFGLLTDIYISMTGNGRLPTLAVISIAYPFLVQNPIYVVFVNSGISSPFLLIILQLN